MKIDRNEPCPCGSGKKYKKCCKSLKTLLGVDDSKPHNKNIGRQSGSYGKYDPEIFDCNKVKYDNPSKRLEVAFPQ
jgi:hypothetical protein